MKWTAAQRRAYASPSYFAFSTIHPRFRRGYRHHSEVLSINTGYE